MADATPTPRPAPHPRRGAHAQRSARTRAQVLAAASALVSQRGPRAASMFEVAKAAGVSPGALQHHFGTKAELMMQLVQHLLAADDGSGVAWPSPRLALARRASAFVQVLWQQVYAAPRFLAAWAVYFASSDDVALMARIARRRHDVNAALRRRLLAVFPELASRRDAEALADLVFGALRGLALTRLFDGDAADAATASARRELARLIESRCRAAAPVLPPRPGARR
ncbi:MAG: TetR/AcrR family transcriptional regulator [Rubrivivax sp.]